MQKALEKTREWTAPFTSQAYFDEVKGIADATGLNYDLLYHLQMFPELTKAQCSFFGAWGSAVKNKGYSYQLRSLDFVTDGPFVEFNQVTVYHPTDGGHAYAQVGWPANIGALSGMSEGTCPRRTDTVLTRQYRSTNTVLTLYWHNSDSVLPGQF